MTHTTNLNLNKPDLNDNVNVATDINDNMDIIDSAYGTLDSNKANAIANAHSTLGTDLDTYTTTGMYGIEGATNCPTGYAYGTLTVTRYSSSAYITQTWQSVIEEKFFIRHSFNGTWQPWEELALNSKITALETIELVSCGNIYINANTSESISKDITKSGYTPIMVSLASTQYANVCLVASTISSNTLSVTLYNGNSVGVTANPQLYVMYKKS